MAGASQAVRMTKISHAVEYRSSMITKTGHITIDQKNVTKRVNICQNSFYILQD